MKGRVMVLNDMRVLMYLATCIENFYDLLSRLQCRVVYIWRGFLGTKKGLHCCIPFKSN